MPSKTKDLPLQSKTGNDEASAKHSSRVRDSTTSDRHGRKSRGSTKRSSTTIKDSRLRPQSGRSTPSTSSQKDPNNPKPSMQASDSDVRPHSASVADSKASVPYPTFSKQHAKEVVGSREDVGLKLDILTPEPTDITAQEPRPSSRGDKQKNGNGNGNGKTQTHRHSTHTRLPSPPLTNDAEPIRRRSTPTASGKKSEDKGHESERHRRTRPRSPRSPSGSMGKSTDFFSRQSIKSSRPSTPGKFKILDAFQLPIKSTPSPKPKSHERGDGRRSSGQRRSPSPRSSTVTAKSTTESTGASDATYVAPKQPKVSQPVMIPSEGSKRQPLASHGPPPPPPPPDIPISMPRVDYLLQYGGLGYHVPRHFLGAGESANMPQELFRPELVAPKLFEPFTTLLDDYEQVMTRNGSLAVATGYRSVARRLLDRLEAVFARDISSETCRCVMCAPEEKVEDAEEASGVSWGEILELVSGRQELPPWPPFNIGSDIRFGLGISISEHQQHVPMQKLDIDVPEEFREHYIRQSRKTKDAVDKWLSRQPDQSNSPPPDEIDDETLAFAMLTYLNDEQRDQFKALLEMPSTPPVPKRETPLPKSRPELLVVGGLAIQRLYRLPKSPRDPEVALYMVRNPDIHHVLATLAAISNDEWDILISGRFDGFLRSGAEDDNIRPLSGFTPQNTTNGKASRTSTRGPSSPPASAGGPISLDEETEIVALAEIERDIFLGMEALEDAFEALHCKAENIRRAVRERAAGLTAARARRGFHGINDVEVLTGTPGPALAEGDSMTDDWIDDNMSEIAPSDSASNISSSRRRRPRRRTERRTPAPVEEEDEENC